MSGADNFRSELMSSGMHAVETTHKVQNLPRHGQGDRIISVLVTPKQDTNARHFTGVTHDINCVFTFYCHIWTKLHLRVGWSTDPTISADGGNLDDIATCRDFTRRMKHLKKTISGGQSTILYLAFTLANGGPPPSSNNKRWCSCR